MVENIGCMQCHKLLHIVHQVLYYGNLLNETILKISCSFQINLKNIIHNHLSLCDIVIHMKKESKYINTKTRQADRQTGRQSDTLV